MENKQDLMRDPVCGMTVDPATAKFHAIEGGQAYYFCSKGCQAKFLADPSAYITQAPRSAAAGMIFTCPMHPQIRRTAPGNCPICGMALEPLTATEQAGPSPELIDMSRRFWIASVLRWVATCRRWPAPFRPPHRPGSSSRSARRLSCGRGGHSSRAAGHPCEIAR